MASSAGFSSRCYEGKSPPPRLDFVAGTRHRRVGVWLRPFKRPVQFLPSNREPRKRKASAERADRRASDEFADDEARCRRSTCGAECGRRPQRRRSHQPKYRGLDCPLRGGVAPRQLRKIPIHLRLTKLPRQPGREGKAPRRVCRRRRGADALGACGALSATDTHLTVATTLSQVA